MKLKIAFKANDKPKEYSIQRFEELFGITYLKELTFIDWESEQWLRKRCSRAFKRGKVGQLAQWLGKFHGKEIAAGKIPEIAIKWIHNQIGYGLFTQKPFKKWEYVGEYTGLLRRRNLFFPNVNDYCFMYPRLWVGTRGYTIDSEKHGNYTRFINHSDSPNCESVSVLHDGVFHIIFRAIEDIPSGTELTYDYGDIYWRGRKKLREEEKIEDLVPPEAILL